MYYNQSQNRIRIRLRIRLNVKSEIQIRINMPNPTGMVYNVYTVPVDYPAFLPCTSQYA